MNYFIYFSTLQRQVLVEIPKYTPKKNLYENIGQLCCNVASNLTTISEEKARSKTRERDVQTS